MPKKKKKRPKKGESLGSLQRSPVIYKGKTHTEVQDLPIQHSANTKKQSMLFYYKGSALGLPQATPTKV